MILFIHGVSQQDFIDRPQDLESIWRDHLRTGLIQFSDVDVESIISRTRLAFYADITNPASNAEPIQSEAASYFYEELISELEGNPPTQAWYHSEILSGTLRTIDNSSLLRSTIGEALLRAVSLEATIYLDNKDVRKKVHQRALEACDGSHHVDLVVGHSLGSVVAYDLIKSGAITTRGLVTLGSPLGSNAFRRRLNPCPAKLKGRISTWHDVRDPLDLVAFQRINITELSAEHADGNPSFHCDEVDNPTNNKHGIGGYLPLRATATRILQVV
jgi:hypothetical protein